LPIGSEPTTKQGTSFVTTFDGSQIGPDFSRAEGAFSLTEIPSVCAVIFVYNVARLRDFYQKVISMAIVVDECDYAILALPHFELVIHGIPSERPTDANAKEFVEVREDGYCKICLPVKHIENARTIARELGGTIKEPDHEWTARGFRACDGHDPEGNVFQVRESIG